MHINGHHTQWASMELQGEGQGLLGEHRRGATWGPARAGMEVAMRDMGARGQELAGRNGREVAAARAVAPEAAQAGHAGH